MIYSTSRCPSCGQVIRKQTNPVNEIGIPFERCYHCGTVYRNSYKEEWITKSPIKRVFFFLQSYVWARAFMLPMLLVMIPVAAFDLETEFVWILWPILSLAWLVGGYFVHKKAEREDILKSVERTSDAEYLNLLKEAGYKIYPIEEEYRSCVSQPIVIKENTSHTPDQQNFFTHKEVCFCRKCGQKLVAGSLYCHKCGEKVMVDTNK